MLWHSAGRIWRNREIAPATADGVLRSASIEQQTKVVGVVITMSSQKPNVITDITLKTLQVS